MLNTGTLGTDKNNILAGATMAMNSNREVKNEWVKLPVMAFLIETEGRKILYDLGSHPDAMKGYWPKHLTEIYPLTQEPEGLLGLLVLGKKNNYLLPQDAVYTSEVYGPPAKASGLLYDSLSYFKSIEKVRKLEKEYNAKVFFAHDWEYFQTIHKAPEFYS